MHTFLLLCQCGHEEFAWPCFPGTDVVIVKSGRRICGTGACLANAPLHQNKSYFEFKIQSTGEYL